MIGRVVIAVIVLLLPIVVGLMLAAAVRELLPHDQAVSAGVGFGVGFLFGAVTAIFKLDREDR